MEGSNKAQQVNLGDGSSLIVGGGDGSALGTGPVLLSSSIGGGGGEGIINTSLAGETSKSTSSMVSFMRNLDKIQEHQIVFTNKIEREKKRKAELDEQYEVARQDCRELQHLTRNGTIVNEDSKVNKGIIYRLEKKLQSAKIKYSVARRDNTAMKVKIDNLRKDKKLQMQIKEDMEKEISEATRRSKHIQHEISVVNSKRHNIQMSIANAKHAIVRDMDEFSRELANTKESLSATQAAIFGTIKERLHMTFEQASQRMYNQQQQQLYLQQQLRASEADFDANNQSAEKDELKLYTTQLFDLVNGSGFNSVEELLADLEVSEDQIFNCYNEIQEKSIDLEKIELENKHLESQLSEQMSKLDALEKYNSKVRQELEQHISQIQLQIAKYDAEYAKSLEVLNTISDSLIVLLKNVSIEGEAKDQQILSTGITDRNIDDYLGIIEQRIDDLIQMAYAASHHPLQREDFLRSGALEHQRQHHVVASNHNHVGSSLRPPPVLPSLADADNDDDFLSNSFGASLTTGLNNTGNNNTSNNAAANSNALGNTATSTGIPTGTTTTNVSVITSSQLPMNDDPARVQPINIGLLKEYMAKKMNKQINGNNNYPGGV